MKWIMMCVMCVMVASCGVHDKGELTVKSAKALGSDRYYYTISDDTDNGWALYTSSKFNVGDKVEIVVTKGE